MNVALCKQNVLPCFVLDEKVTGLKNVPQTYENEVKNHMSKKVVLLENSNVLCKNHMLNLCSVADEISVVPTIGLN